MSQSGWLKHIAIAVTATLCHGSQQTSSTCIFSVIRVLGNISTEQMDAWDILLNVKSHRFH